MYVIALNSAKKVDVQVVTATANNANISCMYEDSTYAIEIHHHNVFILEDLKVHFISDIIKLLTDLFGTQASFEKVNILALSIFESSIRAIGDWTFIDLRVHSVYFAINCKPDP